MFNLPYTLPKFTACILSFTLLGCATNMPTTLTEQVDLPQSHENIQPFNFPAPRQFSQSEAMAMLEFCVNLDSQDDLHPSPNRVRPRAIYKMREDRIVGWEKRVDSRELVAKKIYPDERSAGYQSLIFDPKKNGFGPFDVAWTLWENAAAETWALVFRGTVFSSKPSVDEDILLTTVAAKHGLEIGGHVLPIVFAEIEHAEVHEGFAYGTFSALFDKNFGALQKILELIPKKDTLILAGHSQGAAVAVLAHALIYHALNSSDRSDPFRLRDKGYLLKSYTFAEPRPGNLQFALDFARITGSGANSFAFNNTIDPVTMIPTTHSFIAGAFEDAPNKHGWRILRATNFVLNLMNRDVTWLFEKGLRPALRKINESNLQDYDLNPEALGHLAKPPSGLSQNYVAAGDVIPLIGYKGKDINYYYHLDADQDDEFIQHHATTYRRLMEDLFKLSPTTYLDMENQRPSSRAQ